MTSMVVTFFFFFFFSLLFWDFQLWKIVGNDVIFIADIFFRFVFRERVFSSDRGVT